MTVHSDAALLAERLDEQTQCLLDQQGERRLFVLPRFLRLLQTDPHLAGLVDDLREETAGVLSGLQRADAELRDHLRRAWAAHGPELRRLLADVEDPALDAFGSMDGYEAALSANVVLSFPPDGTTPTSPTTDRLNALRHWTKWATDTTSDLPSGIDDLGSELQRLERAHQHQLRALRAAATTMGYPALLRLRAISERVNPVPPPEGADLVEWAAFMEKEGFARKVHEPERRLHERLTFDAVDVALRRIDIDARLLQDELRYRLSIGRSRHAIVRRYAARCEGFDAARLRGIANDAPRSAERALTLDFARYLFDDGLTPAIDLASRATTLQSPAAAAFEIAAARASSSASAVPADCGLGPVSSRVVAAPTAAAPRCAASRDASAPESAVFDSRRLHLCFQVARERVTEHVPPDAPEAGALAGLPERPLALALREERPVVV